jgi:1,2-dihydroxy-3-keto-5-methylthiopentene dioxygenase
MQAGQPGWPALRRQFQQEHWHREAELRAFVGGAGLFLLRRPEGFVGLLCEAGDWVALPAGLAHSFDAGAEPAFDALRLLGQAEGWVAHASGQERPALPDFDAFVSQLLEQTGYASPDDLIC